VQIAWESFTPFASLAGGLLIGLAASWLLLMNGRIAGISGMLGGLVTGLLTGRCGWPSCWGCWPPPWSGAG